MTNLVIKQILDLIFEKKNTFFNFIKNKNNSYRLIIIDICNLTCNQKLFISQTTLPILILDD